MPPRRVQRLYVVKNGFFADGYGLVSKDERFAEEHPLIRRYPEEFIAAEEGARGVEQATAAPGEQRGAPTA